MFIKTAVRMANKLALDSERRGAIEELIEDMKRLFAAGRVAMFEGK